MLPSGFQELTMWCAYRDRLREAKENRLAWQARAGHGRHRHILSLARHRAGYLRSWWGALLRRQPTLTGRETAPVSRTDGGLML